MSRSISTVEGSTTVCSSTKADALGLSGSAAWFLGCMAMRRRLHPLGMTWLSSILGHKNAAHASMKGVSLEFDMIRNNLFSMATPAIE